MVSVFLVIKRGCKTMRTKILLLNDDKLMPYVVKRERHKGKESV